MNQVPPSAADSLPLVPVPVPARRTRVLLACACAVPGVALVLLAMRYERPTPVQAAASTDLTVHDDRVKLARAAPQWRVLKVEPATPAVAHWTDPVPGRVRIDERVASKIGAPLGGRVTSVKVEPGQRVTAGDPLVTITSPELADLRAQGEKAALDLDVARTALERVQAMVAARALPAKEELAAVQAVRQAEVAQRLAQNKLASLCVRTDKDNEYTVNAPRDGVVVERSVAPDQQVTTDPSTGPLLVVADLSTVLVFGELFEADALEVRAGTEVEVTAAAAPQQPIKASVEMVSAIVDPVRHTVAIRVRVPNADGHLRPNAYVQVRFNIPPREQTLEIQASALLSDGVTQRVYVAGSDGEFVPRVVTVGAVVGGRAMILSGLAPGDAVVTEGALLLDNQVHLSH